MPRTRTVRTVKTVTKINYNPKKNSNIRVTGDSGIPSLAMIRKNVARAKASIIDQAIRDEFKALSAYCPKLAV